MTKSEETKCKRIFCVLAARGYPPEEAARRAGYENDCCARAALLLWDHQVRREIARLSKALAFCAPGRLARAGLERLALGDADSALGLLFADGEDALPQAGLFHVAEVKRPKGGGVEVKFFDRLRALSLLAELDGGQGAAAGSLLAALEKSAGEIGGGDNGPV